MLLVVRELLFVNHIDMSCNHVIQTLYVSKPIAKSFLCVFNSVALLKWLVLLCRTSALVVIVCSLLLLHLIKQKSSSVHSNSKNIIVVSIFDQSLFILKYDLKCFSFNCSILKFVGLKIIRTTTIRENRWLWENEPKLIYNFFKKI